jgi:hypothetical protein
MTEKMVGKAEPMYTQEEMNFREDLLQKLMTCDHVRGVLIAREDSPIFIHQIENMKQIFQRWYQEAINEKTAAMQKQDAREEGEEPDS